MSHSHKTVDGAGDSTGSWLPSFKHVRTSTQVLFHMLLTWNAWGVQVTSGQGPRSTPAFTPRSAATLAVQSPHSAVQWSNKPPTEAWLWQPVKAFFFIHGARAGSQLSQGTAVMLRVPQGVCGISDIAATLHVAQDMCGISDTAASSDMTGVAVAAEGFVLGLSLSAIRGTPQPSQLSSQLQSHVSPLSGLPWQAKVTIK